MDQELISVNNISFEYSNQKILEDISFKIYKGDYIGILGPNGGGKSTLLKLLLGLLQPSQGEVLVKGKKFRHLPPGLVGYVPQRTATLGLDFPAIVKEVIESSLIHKKANLKDPKIVELIELSGIQKLMGKMLSDLSGGERQKVYIVRSLILQPEILILDEPTTATDTVFEAGFYDFIKELKESYKLTVMLVSHDVGFVAKEVERIFFLNKKITCYHSSDEFTNERNLQRLYGTNSNVILHNH